MSNTCSDCGSKSYGGHCTWCHEETYIAEQNYGNYEPICFSESFNKKLAEQATQAQQQKERGR